MTNLERWKLYERFPHPGPCGVILMYTGYRVCLRYLGLFVLSSQITKVNFPEITDDNYILMYYDPLKVSSEPMRMKLKLSWKKTGLEIIKLFSCSTQLSTKFITLIVSCSFISMINTTTDGFKARTFLTFQLYSFMSCWNIMLSWLSMNNILHPPGLIRYYTKSKGAWVTQSHTADKQTHGTLMKRYKWSHSGKSFVP